MIDGEKKLITFSPAKQMEIDRYRANIEGDAAKACTPF